jgi:hypothetical protein
MNSFELFERSLLISPCYIDVFQSALFDQQEMLSDLSVDVHWRAVVLLHIRTPRSLVSLLFEAFFIRYANH